MNLFKLMLMIFIIGLGPVWIYGQTNNDAPISPNAPTDKPHRIKDSTQLAKYDKMIEPYMRKALKTLPDAKKRFLKGLPLGEAFFLTTRIYDENGSHEQIFVRVTEWNGKTIKGTIANELTAVKSYKFGQLIEFPESAILDWLITKPNGDEEGNYVGKFLDSLR